MNVTITHKSRSCVEKATIDSMIKLKLTKMGKANNVWLPHFHIGMHAIPITMCHVPARASLCHEN